MGAPARHPPFHHMISKYLQPKQIVFGFQPPNNGTLEARHVADTLRCTREHVYNLIGCGELAATNIGTGLRNVFRVARQDLFAFIDARTTGPRKADFTRTEAPNGLDLPDGPILTALEVASVLRCSHEHVCDLVRSLDLMATDISAKPGRTVYRIARTSLVQFLCSRREGAF